MKRIFVALVISYLLVILAAFVLGVLVRDDRSFALHFMIGLLATIFTCFVHCAVITYFVITGKMIKQAVLTKHLPEAWITQSQQAKGRAARAGVMAVLLALGAALLGAWTQMTGVDSEWIAVVHMLAEMLAASCNLLVFAYQFRVISDNTQLVDQVFAHFNAAPSAPGVAAPGG